MKHIKLPWGTLAIYINPSNKKTIMRRDDYLIVEPNGDYIACADTREYAEFIVRACNNHYQLLEACKSIMESVVYDKLNTYDLDVTYKKFIKQAEAAIKQAEGDQ